MNIKFNNLIEKLNYYNPQLYLSDNYYNSLFGVKLLEKKQENLEPDYLYIGKLSDLETLSFNQLTVNVLCIADIRIPEKYTKMSNLNLIVLKNAIDLTSLIGEVLDYFSTEQEHIQSLTRLLETFTNAKDLQHIIDMGYEVIGNPIFLIDTSFKLLSYTKNIDIDDFLWNELTQNGYFRSESIFNFRNERSIEKVTKSTSPILFPACKPTNINKSEATSVTTPSSLKSKTHPRIISSVIIDNNVVANLCVIAYFKSFKSYDMELVEILCKSVSVEMRKSSCFSKTRGKMYEYFIADLLSGSITNIIVEERIKSLDWKLKRNFCVIVIKDKQFSKESIPFKHIKTILETIIVGSKSIEYDDSIVLIINNNLENPISETAIKDLKAFLLKYNLYGGISHNFSKIINISKYYKQALSAIQIGYRMNKDATLYYYEDYTIFDMFDICSTQRDLNDLCHPALIALLEYDKKYNTNYSETLYAYISNGQNQTKSANDLHIHRNTITYRIAKIVEIIGKDLDDSTLMLHLQLSFKILEYINLGKKLFK